ncbi:hypothetical protein HPB51_019250 [Rhipicephalus microplus]|uniref:Uncharacterized protein n=1 Tax=Rhipicephalus microplus TaxID=6941 RepID=A0A9J6F7T2_RHIMP|nr:hypothetical protein HPB51_019250 [Rhipicephalus microplus]
MEHASTPSRESVFSNTFTFKERSFDADLSDRSPKCATAASKLATDTTSAHMHRNASVEIAAFSTKVNTMMIASQLFNLWLRRTPHHRPGLPSLTKGTWASCSERRTPAPRKAQ